MARLSGRFDAPTRQLRLGNDARSLNAYSANALQFERINCERVALPRVVAMASKPPPQSLPVRGRAVGALERVSSKRWRQLEQVAQALRSLGDTPLTRARAELLAQRFGVHWATIYRYRLRLAEIDEVTAIAGRTRGWKQQASRLFSPPPTAISLQNIGSTLQIIRSSTRANLHAGVWIPVPIVPCRPDHA